MNFVCVKECPSGSDTIDCHPNSIVTSCSDLTIYPTFKCKFLIILLILVATLCLPKSAEIFDTVKDVFKHIGLNEICNKIILVTGKNGFMM